MNKTTILALFLIINSSHSYAAIPLQKLLIKVQATCDNTKDFSADFKQSYEKKRPKSVIESTGKILLKKPGLMRWDYKTPTKKSFILDGKALWLYDEEDKFVQVDRCFKDSNLTTPVAFLWGKGRISQEFTTRWLKIPGEKDAEFMLLLTPKKKNALVKNIELGVDAKTFRVTQSTVIDSQNNRNQFVFSNMNYKAGLKVEQFAFVPPKGVKVQNMQGTCENGG